MSVTFSIATTPEDVTGWTVTCTSRNLIDGGLYDFDRAREVAAGHALACPDDICGHYGPDLFEVTDSRIPDGLDVNVTSHHASGLFRLLGLPAVNEDGEFGVGSCDALDFLGRAQIALGVAPADTGMPARTLTDADLTDETLNPMARALAAAGATVIDMGRPEGYHQERLSQLADLALAAHSVGRQIQWA